MKATLFLSMALAAVTLASATTAPFWMDASVAEPAAFGKDQVLVTFEYVVPESLPGVEFVRTLSSAKTVVAKITDNSTVAEKIQQLRTTVPGILAAEPDYLIKMADFSTSALQTAEAAVCSITAPSPAAPSTVVSAVASGNARKLLQATPSPTKAGDWWCFCDQGGRRRKLYETSIVNGADYTCQPCADDDGFAPLSEALACVSWCSSSLRTYANGAGAIAAACHGAGCASAVAKHVLNAASAEGLSLVHALQATASA